MAERGTFAFTFQSNTPGNSKRVFALVYVPVPERGALVSAGFATAGLAYYRRRQPIFPSASGAA
jgi:hypothetical protein